ncbi:PHP domain-containing protein [Candidatus Venteria ishoeyi]|uniref:Error-prone DNA polymerase n=1 Tax=Candidatus Venteria ishoeyi TaxID=1899563 RepID=A0A1H6FC22_9GAMM|nr:PHP domain-containing protein [Candidatus Venteria ishoeyi]MDM8546335.1 PHP domain-containing protein [Candidatus Venteria ishoeyi]SEH06941.1 error-prone DNA polymerase [Candidatus Venteria ishoeyi]
MTKPFSPIDLHAHSTASDGSLSPLELVQRAAKRGLHTLALTDHDTTAGIAEAQAGALQQNTPLQLIAGVEISVTWNNQTLHIVGLNIDPEHTELQAGLQQIRAERELRAHKMAEKLEKTGLKDVYQSVKAFAGGGLISRTHFAHYLVEQGRASHVRKVFQRYLVAGKPGYVGAQWATLEETLHWIKQAGGIAVIAHPARYKITRTRLKKLLDAFKALGGQGLEVVSGSHSLDDNFQMAQLAQYYDLLASMGSDYHGAAHFWLELGVLPALPAGCRGVWEAWS